jgi:hypothetical protein
MPWPKVWDGDAQFYGEAAAAARKFRRFIITSSLSLASLETKQPHQALVQIAFGAL